MNYTERKAKNQVFFYITSGSGFMTPLISVLIIPGAVSTAVNMVTAMVKRICNGIEKRLLKKGQLIKTQLPFQTVDKVGVGIYFQHHFSLYNQYFDSFLKI